MYWDRINEKMSGIKLLNLETLAEYHRNLCKHPELREMFFELTLKCNENCFHCGRSCGADRPGGLPVEEYKRVLDEIKAKYGTRPYIAITGGEPLMYPDFFEFTEYVRDSGFNWGMTSNGTLITKDVAHRLAEAGMKTISVSIDGIPETHDRYRGFPGGYKKAMEGIQNLIDEDAFGSIMITTVVNHENINELDALFEMVDNTDINEWRLTGIEPIGRALDHENLLLTPEDNIRLMEFIKEKRALKLPVTYSCCHYLGEKYEAEVRDWYFLCNAGVYVAGVTSNGDISACLDIPRSERTIQGNILKDSFTDVWENRFELFRTPLSELNEKCKECAQAKFCRGGSYHSWDFENDRPLVCMKEVLF